MRRSTATAPPTSLSATTSMRWLSAGSCLDPTPELVPGVRGAGFDPVRVRLAHTLQDRFVSGLDLIPMSVPAHFAHNTGLWSELRLFAPSESRLVATEQRLFRELHGDGHNEICGS